MEITMENFWRQLPRVLLSIATSQFVAIDLEMTGIADKDLEGNETPNRLQIYERAKKIASTFNVFDLGITCIMAQPVFEKGGVRLEKIYEDCVPYLSRRDVRKATQRMEKRMKPWKEREHPYNEDDEGLKLFSAYVWDTIDDWLYMPDTKRPTEIEILVPRSDSKKRTSIYHQIVRRKAQVLVPHMRCRVWNHGATVVIYTVDDEKEKEKRKTLRDRLSASLRKYSGIRLVIEALAGGDFAELIDVDCVVDALSACPDDAETFCEKLRLMLQQTSPTHSEDASEDESDDSEGQDVRDWASWSDQAEDYASGNGGYSCGPREGSASWDDGCTDDEELPAKSLGDKVALAFKLVEDRLKESRPVIVGHNQFMDLLFLYNTFIDDLPDSLDDFLAEVHELFPFVIDTKLLAIQDQAIEGEDPLVYLYNRLSDRNTMPQISWHTAYGYGRSGAAHQAGYDSYMTATVFLRLAYKLAGKNLTGEDAGEADRKLSTLYSREWLSAVGHDPDRFGGKRSSSPSWSEPPEADSVAVGQPEWGDPAFDLVRNTIRIAPRRTAYLGG
ncbi:hypothetical protein LX36DRAFT_706938 [Colletotrichum falcatum]|nr:hypothetical protein LX36DRAFT_706938 [Colletotrichum falcatum]